MRDSATPNRLAREPASQTGVVDTASTRRPEGARGARDLLLELDLRRGALGRGLRESLRAAIQDGRLRAHTRLPSSRRLADDLGVSRGVVSDAYDQLVSEGYLEVQPRSAPHVAAVATAPVPRPEPDVPAWRYDFISTTPEVGMFPRRAWLRAVERVLRVTPDAALSYSDRRGRPELRMALSAYLGRVRGVRADPSRIVITQGFTQALDLLCRTLAASGVPAVAAESPSLPEFWTTIRGTGVRLTACPVDYAGMLPDALGALDVGAVVVTPAHQFPMGGVLLPSRRHALLTWASRTGGFVIEDDYDAEFRYDRTPVGAMQGLDPGRVIHGGTTSKSLAPGLRLGWLTLPASLVEEFVTRKFAADSGSPAIEQLAFADLLVSGEYERHVSRLRRMYRRRRDVLVRSISARRPDLELRGVAAGTHAFLRLPPDVNDIEIAEAANARGIRVQPLSSLCLRPTPERGLVLGYGRLPDHQVERAVMALCEVIPPRRRH